MKENNNLTQYVWKVLAVIFALILFFGSFKLVPAGSVGVVTRFSAVNRVVYPGILLKIPLIEGVTTMDTRTQKDQVDAEAASSDLQTIHSTIAVNYHLEGARAVDVYQNIGTDYQEKVIAPAIQESFKAITAKYTAEKLITQREQLREEGQDSLREKLKQYHIVVDNFNIVNFDFSADFNNAIEQKQVAQQNLEKAKIEAETASTQAQGQANAQKILRDNESLTPEYLQFLAVQKWDGKLPLSTSGVPFLNLPTK